MNKQQKEELTNIAIEMLIEDFFRQSRGFKPNPEIMALMDELDNGEKSLEEVYHIVKESLQTKMENFLSKNDLPIITIDDGESFIKK